MLRLASGRSDSAARRASASICGCQCNRCGASRATCGGGVGGVRGEGELAR